MQQWCARFRRKEAKIKIDRREWWSHDAKFDGAGAVVYNDHTGGGASPRAWADESNAQRQAPSILIRVWAVISGQAGPVRPDGWWLKHHSPPLVGQRMCPDGARA